MPSQNRGRPPLMLADAYLQWSMRLRTWLTAAVCRLALILPCLGGALLADAAQRPNIVFILTDDQAPTAAGFAGNAELMTPHLDRLAQEGAVLTNAFVTTPVCSPSRAGLAVSRYGGELGILDWINPNSEAELGLDPQTVTWMEVLNGAGYRLGLFGKWHLGTQPRFHPTKMGYHEFAGILEGGCKPIGATIEAHGERVENIGYTADVFTDYALDFIRREQESPFVCSLHFREPHAAWLPCPDEDWAPYKDLNPTLPEPDFPNLKVDHVRKMLREYYASVAGVDRNVGRVLALLDELELSENTLVVFTSDHGYHNGHHGLWFKGNAQWQTDPLPPQRCDNIPAKQRPNLYDQALRVPTVVRWPARIAAGRPMERCVTNLDWYPTLLAAAGVSCPSDFLIRGRNFLPLLEGSTVDWNDGFYAEYSMRHGAKTDMRAWRTPDWKLMIDFANPGRGELYDLAHDPGEVDNLFDSDRPEIRAVRDELERALRSRMDEIGDFAAAAAN
ncbi:MAG: sulfatase-like hydrolase/transferase [Planctomycetaceae bacterium]|nr:sulfatase-like hydrolase/transferase [Planctomycetaceae bacterium]